MRKKIEKVCVIGSGKLAFECALYAAKQKMPVVLFDMAQKKSIFTEKQAAAAGIPYYRKEPKQVFWKLQNEEKTLLLVSAVNEKIVPEEVLKKKNITALNLHQSLLPAHPGRNAEAWAIFEQDERSGITWHRMNGQVDGGEIFIQKEIELHENMTSYLLFKKQIECAYEAYQEIFSMLIEGSLQGVPQKEAQKHKIHYKKDIPAGGILDTSWNGEKISAFLRALDYGGLHVFPKPKLYYQGKTYQWKKYEIVPCKANEEQKIYRTDSDIMIKKDNLHILLKNYEAVEE